MLDYLACIQIISIHALREEGDLRPLDGCTAKCSYFYPRPPRGGRRWASSGCTSAANFYPRPPRGGRPNQTGGRLCSRSISIHALREEGDSP